jgi:hypothetical protein
MFMKANSGRDAFTFSLRGMRAIASFTAMPVIADDRINRMIGQRLAGRQEDQPDTARRIEDFLARYFAPGCCRQAA